MKFNFFTPINKVHKQRNVMKDTDMRVVRYSKTGIALSLFVFCLSMFLGEFYQRQPTLAMVFGVGILFTTAVRMYFLFRFDVLYARGPALWRERYFLITIGSAAWWGLMLAGVSYEVGLQYETPLLLLFTVAFFSSSSHVYATYLRFYHIYLMVTLLPSSLVVLLSFESLSSLYGLIMLVLVVLLHRQGNSQNRIYWDGLQATYDLTQRANALEAEKITSQSTLSDKDTLFTNLAGELKRSIREVIGGLQLLKLANLPEQEKQLVTLSEQKSHQQMQMLKNILEFSRISRHDLLLSSDVIDLRGALEKAIADVSDQVYKKRIEMLTQFSSDFPARVRGDGERIEQIMVNMINSAVNYVDYGNLLLDVTYIGDSDSVGRLKVVLMIENPLRNAEIEQQLHDMFKPHHASDMSQSLSLAIAKGLTNCMQGSAGANYVESGQLRFWFTANLPTVKPASSDTQNISKLNGKRMLLFQPPKTIENEYRNNFEAWGFIVDIIYDYQDAVTAVENSLKSPTFFNIIVIYTYVDNLEGVALSKEILDRTRSQPTPQLLCITETQSKSSLVQELLEQPTIELLLKPVGYKALRKRLKNLLVTDNIAIAPKIEEEFLTNKHILLLQNEEIDRTIAEVMLQKLGCNTTTVHNTDEAMQKLQEMAFDAFITESHIDNIDMKAFIDNAKAANAEVHGNNYSVPILGLSNQEQSGDEIQCLQSGMNYFIDSPLQIDDLRAILRRWIGRAVHIAESAQETAEK